MPEKLRGNIETQVGLVYSFLESLYPANWQIRWGNAPYVEGFASTDDIKEFLSSKGRFETVPGHVWACHVLWTMIRRTCPYLNVVVDSAGVHDRITLHDIGETYQGDTPIVTKINAGYEVGKDSESEEYTRLVGVLGGQGSEFANWLDQFENFDEDIKQPLEALVARWIDQMQGDHFALVFGKNLSSYSDLVGRVIKKRSILRSRTLIDAFLERSRNDIAKRQIYQGAAEEVEEVTRTHIKVIKNKGIAVDLSGLGF